MVLGEGNLIFPPPTLRGNFFPLRMARYTTLRVCPLEVIHLDIAACPACIVVPAVVFGKTDGSAKPPKEIAHSDSATVLSSVGVLPVVDCLYPESESVDRHPTEYGYSQRARSSRILDESIVDEFVEMLSPSLSWFPPAAKEPVRSEDVAS